MPIARKWALIAVLTSGAGSAVADDRSEARSAYDRGAEAYARGDYATAVAELARADELAPNASALLAALRAASLVSDPVIAMNLVRRAESRSELPKELSDLVAALRKRYADATSELLVRCSGCSADLDGFPLPTHQRAIVLSGRRKLLVRTDADVRRFDLDLVPGDVRTIDVTLEVAKPTLVVREVESPSWVPVLAGAGVTAVLGTVATLSGIDTVNTHDAFESRDCRRVGSATCTELAVDGQSAQLRTHLLIGAAVLTGAATGLIWFASHGL